MTEEEKCQKYSFAKFAISHYIKCLKVKCCSMIEKQKRLKSLKNSLIHLREGVFFVAIISLGLVTTTVDRC
ncbi:MAG: hypothetical protein K2H55_02545 [Helicobacter sp.]|nr:hypothetical protein [Helicobacter sp.]